MSEIKQKGLEAKLLDGTTEWTVTVDTPMYGISVGTDGYHMDKIDNIYVLPEGISVIVPRDPSNAIEKEKEIIELIEGVYAAANRNNAETILNNVGDHGRNPESLRDYINKECEKVNVTEDQLYDLLSTQDNLYRVPKVESEPQPGLLSRIKEAVLPTDNVTRMLGYTIVGSSLLIGGLIAYDLDKRQSVQEPVQETVQVEPVQVEPTAYETCEAAREAYKASKNVADRREIRTQIKTLCE